MHKISAQSDVIVKSYRVNGRTDDRTDTLTDFRVYSLFEYTKRESIMNNYINNIKTALAVFSFQIFLFSIYTKSTLDCENRRENY